MKKFLKKTFQNYKIVTKVRFKDTYLKQYLDYFKKR